MTDYHDGLFPIEQQERMHDAFNGYCAHPKCLEKISEFHHKLENTKHNREQFPLFIKSPFNMYPTCRTHHVSGDRPRIKKEEAEIYESYLKETAEGKYKEREGTES